MKLTVYTGTDTAEAGPSLDGAFASVGHFEQQEDGFLRFVFTATESNLDKPVEDQGLWTAMVSMRPYEAWTFVQDAISLIAANLPTLFLHSRDGNNHRVLIARDREEKIEVRYLVEEDEAADVWEALIYNAGRNPRALIEVKPEPWQLRGVRLIEWHEYRRGAVIAGND